MALGACGESVTFVELPAPKSWEPALLVESISAPVSAGGASLYDSGEAIVVWQVNLGYELSEIGISRFDPGIGWSESATVSDVPSWSFSPLLASDSPETAVVVWLGVKPDPASYQQLYAATYSAANGWSPEILLSLQGEHAQRPSITGSHDGSAMVIWDQSEPSGYNEVFGARFQPGVGWDASTVIEDADASVSSPTIVGDATATSTGFWFKDNFPSVDMLVATSHQPATGWGAIGSLTALDSPIVNLGIASDHTDGAVVAFAQNNGLYVDVFAVDYSSTGGWQTPVSIGGNDPQPGGIAVANGANGDSFIAWPRRSGPNTSDPNDIVVSRRVSGGDWEEPVVIDEGAGSAIFVTLAADNHGGAVAAWLQHDGETESVFAASFNPTVGWSAPQLLEDRNGTPARWQEAYPPLLTMNSMGEAMAVWTQYDGTEYSVFSAHFR